MAENPLDRPTPIEALFDKWFCEVFGEEDFFRLINGQYNHLRKMEGHL